MAQHVQDISVFERKLRPIYDSLEMGNNKKALQEVDKLLKKNPQLTCARALKALAFLRLGREDESNQMLAALTDEKPCDDATLQVLTFCYKEMEQLEKIVDLYTHAAKQSPGSEEILAHLFISYVRLNDYKSQQAIALQLYKLKPKNPYYFWAVMSVVLQAVRGPESKIPEKRKLFLALAQRMVDKLIAEDKLDAEQEVQLYLYILEEQGKHKEALDFMEGLICEKLYPGAPIYDKINLMKRMDKWHELHTLLKSLLCEERDRWDFYQEYLTICFKLIEEDMDNKDQILDSCHDFLCQLIESGKRVRGPYLARLELHKRMREFRYNADELLGNFSDLIIEYFRFFGDKACCTHDISLFLGCIETKERRTLATKLLQETGISSTTLPQSKEQLQKHIVGLQISRVCGAHQDLNEELLLALYTALRLHYEHGLSNFGKNLLPTDMGPSDPYAILAAHVMYDVSHKTGKSKYLIEALCLLHYVLRNSPSNFHAKLLCLKIYHFFGCALGAQQMYDSLDIKHVQLDSLGYLHCLLLPMTGLVSVARHVYDITLKFFTSSYKERLEYIAMSYKFGSFSKLQEFMDFRDRLSNSLHYAMISAEQILSELVCLSGTIAQNLNVFKLMSIHPEDDRIQWNDLADNRDLSAVVRWDDLDATDLAEGTESFNDDIELLQIRSTLLRLIASFVDLLHFPKNSPAIANGDKSGNSNASNAATVVLLKDSWDEIFNRLRKMNYQKRKNQFLVNLLPSRLHLILDMPYDVFFSNLAEFLIDLNSGSDLKLEVIERLNDNVTKIYTICCEAIRIQNECEDNVWTRRDLQFKIVASVEILSLYAFVLSMIHEKLTTLQQVSKKTRRKDTIQTNVQSNSKSNISVKDRFQVVVDLMRNLKQHLQNCDNAIDNWNQPKFDVSLKECMNGMSLNPTVEASLLTTVGDIFKENRLQTIKEFRAILKDKIRMVNK